MCISDFSLTWQNISVQLLRNRLVATARKSMSQNASLSQLYGSMQDAYQQMQTPLVYQQQSVRRVRLTLHGTSTSLHFVYKEYNISLYFFR